MKIALNGSLLLSPLTGVGQYVHELANGLIVKDEVDLNIFYGYNWSKTIRQSPIPKINKYKNIVSNLLPNPRIFSRKIKQFNFNKGIKKIKPDLYHETSTIAYDYKGKTILTVHDLSWIRFPDFHPADRVSLLNKYFERGLVNANKIITDSEYIKSELVSLFGVNSEKIESIPLAVNNNFHPKTNELTSKTLDQYSLKYKSFLLAIGTLEPRKNIELAIDAFMQLPASVRRLNPLVLIGIKGWHTTNLERVISPLIASGEIRQLGYVSRQDLIDITASAKMLIYPSIYEGFGLPPLEAMACGVPVIGSNVSSIPEVVSNAGILIDPHNSVLLKDAILRLLEDKEIYEKLSGLGISRSREFTWESCVNKTFNLYKQVLS